MKYRKAKRLSSSSAAHDCNAATDVTTPKKRPVQNNNVAEAPSAQLYSSFVNGFTNNHNGSNVDGQQASTSSASQFNGVIVRQGPMMPIDRDVVNFDDRPLNSSVLTAQLDDAARLLDGIERARPVDVSPPASPRHHSFCSNEQDGDEQSTLTTLSTTTTESSSYCEDFSRQTPVRKNLIQV